MIRLLVTRQNDMSLWLEGKLIYMGNGRNHRRLFVAVKRTNQFHGTCGYYIDPANKCTGRYTAHCSLTKTSKAWKLHQIVIWIEKQLCPKMISSLLYWFSVFDA